MERIDCYNLKAIPSSHKFALVLQFNGVFFLLVSAETRDSSYIANVERRTHVIGGEMRVVSVEELRAELGVKVAPDKKKQKKRKKKKLKKTNFEL